MPEYRRDPALKHHTSERRQNVRLQDKLHNYEAAVNQQGLTLVEKSQNPCLKK